MGLRLTTTCARKLASPNTSSISSRRYAASLSSMLTQIAERALITSRAATSRGRIIATQASCRLSPSRRADVVGVREVVAGVVGRVDVDQVDLAELGRQPGQHVEVVTLDERVPRWHPANLLSTDRGSGWAAGWRGKAQHVTEAEEPAPGPGGTRASVDAGCRTASCPGGRSWTWAARTADIARMIRRRELVAGHPGVCATGRRHAARREWAAAASLAGGAAQESGPKTPSPRPSPSAGQ